MVVEASGVLAVVDPEDTHAEVGVAVLPRVAEQSAALAPEMFVLGRGPGPEAAPELVLVLVLEPGPAALVVGKLKQQLLLEVWWGAGRP